MMMIILSLLALKQGHVKTPSLVREENNNKIIVIR